jgi:hypothetical protein
MAGLARAGAGVDVTPLFAPGHAAVLDQAIAICSARLQAGSGRRAGRPGPRDTGGRKS